MLLPRLVPEGAHFLRVPCSKRAAMRVVLETVQRGARFWTGGLVPTAKALRFAERMAQLYSVDATQAQRSYAKSRGRANTTLLIYPESVASLRFFLLATTGAGLVHEREQLLDTHDARGRLRWGEQYELLQMQRPRAHGGGRTWTWRLTDERYEMLLASMQRAARNPGRPDARHDDLDALVRALMRMPGFYGIRQQQLALLHAGQEAWRRTHAQTQTYAWPQHVPYLDKSFVCYHRPNALRLDVLVQVLQHRAQGLDDTGVSSRGAG